MPITVNEGGTFSELTNVYSNEGGTRYDLDSIHSNEGGTFYEIHKKKSDITSVTITYRHGGGGSTGSDGGGGALLLSNNTIAQISSSASAASQGGASGSCSWSTTTIPSGSTISITITKSSGTYSSAAGSISLTKIGESVAYQKITSSTTVTLSNDITMSGETNCSAQHGYSANWRAKISIASGNGKQLTFILNDQSS